jgi:ring-1,2-phenylacetyl-CoA epoxidase subunit PaaD
VVSALSIRHDAHAALEQRAWTILQSVLDPEIPVLSIVDLGIVRDVRVTDDHSVEVALSPTYSGCPATEVIRAHVSQALRAQGIERHVIREVLSPPWTSDWITPEGREKLRTYGIAPPASAVSKPRQLFASETVACPRCGSEDTAVLSEFGSTPCKSLRRCQSCLEPFEHFKCI